MRFSEIMSEAPQPPLTQPGAATGAAPSTTSGSTTLAPGQQISQDPQAQQKMLAQQVLDRANRKKQIQDSIKQKQQELADLQKELATIK